MQALRIDFRLQVALFPVHVAPGHGKGKFGRACLAPAGPAQRQLLHELKIPADQLDFDRPTAFNQAVSRIGRHLEAREIGEGVKHDGATHFQGVPVPFGHQLILTRRKFRPAEVNRQRIILRPDLHGYRN